jgi:hypothetical protein
MSPVSIRARSRDSRAPNLFQLPTHSFGSGNFSGVALNSSRQLSQQNPISFPLYSTVMLESTGSFLTGHFPFTGDFGSDGFGAGAGTGSFLAAVLATTTDDDDTAVSAPGTAHTVMNPQQFERENDPALASAPATNPSAKSVHDVFMR